MVLARDAVAYEYDTAAWSAHQVSLLRAGRFADADIEHIIEEIESLGISERHAIKSQLARMQSHLLKQRYQPEKATDSWQQTIDDAAIEIEAALEESPSLRREMSAFVIAAYRTARKKAHIETGLPIATFPRNPTPELEQAVAAALEAIED